MAQAVPHEHIGHPPTALGLNSRKLGIWTFLSSEALFFTALIVTYLVMRPRNAALGGPDAHDLLGLALTSALAFILLMSSVTMVLAHAATERNDQRGMRLWLGATILLGATFVGGQAYEFNKLFHEHFVTVTLKMPDGSTQLKGVLEHHVKEFEPPEGATITDISAPKPVTWTTSLFGSTFFTLTGFHGTHVSVGVIWLSVLLIMAFRGALSARNSLAVDIAALYWHFVDLVWVAIFTLVYLI
jgi:cytochrome c oxidase subunit 3